ncbi:MAG: hypothetical protein IPH20_26255 [Bacteroidales bacterium]|nr:hypothetical protein [Bacteroidales bacterium]
MEANIVYEKFGGLLKEEPLSCVDHSILLPNTCVLESVTPFLGYYNEAPGSIKPLYLYLVLEGDCSFEKTMRASHKIKRTFKHPFDAVAGTVSLFGQQNQVIRVRNLDDFSHVGLLQKAFLDEGIVFKKKIRKIDNENALISLTKFFYLEPVGELMYFDKSQPHHGYFIIPRYVSWEDFKDLTKEVKYDTDLLFFDSAKAFFCENHSITEIVRIYRENLTVDKLKAIRDRYLKLMKPT